ncbi:hypothetical protein KFE25_007657 [Diacronema lutheri]|uniref:YchJ-like middle NTF2-like domain-containing protein n=1 Tax=Diacronema lutheri TaxID=2081491 RepID=A0A8J5XRJ6_DIALT|nr:hypothetical protein KFE25_007657 [Diacronema lutheri]
MHSCVVVLVASAFSRQLANQRPSTHRVPAVRAGGFGNVRARDRRPEPDELCACGSGASYGACCARLHNGALATGVQELIRARFTAYEYKLPNFLLSPAVTTGATDTKAVRKELETYMGSYRFLNLTVGEPVALLADGAGRERAACEMTSCYRARAAEIFRKHSQVINERVVTFSERSVFVRGVDGGWRYSEAESEGSYEGEQGYDREGAEARFREMLADKRARGVALLPREAAYAAQHGL